MPKDHHYFVYLLASKPCGTLYVGVTNDIYRRVLEHRDGVGGEFTRKYGVHLLVWYEEHQDIELAIAREKAIKKWERAWKVRLIEEENSRWRDLFVDMQ